MFANFSLSRVWLSLGALTNISNITRVFHTTKSVQETTTEFEISTYESIGLRSSVVRALDYNTRGRGSDSCQGQVNFSLAILYGFRSENLETFTNIVHC